MILDLYIVQLGMSVGYYEITTDLNYSIFRTIIFELMNNNGNGKDRDHGEKE